MLSAGNSLASRDVAYLLHPNTALCTHEAKGPVVVERGDGIYVFDESGHKFLEAVAGLWCASLGFSEHRLADAAAAQMRRLPFYHLFGGRTHDVAVELAERIIRLMPVPMSKVFFNSSGSEANDTALKIVWYYNNALGRPRKKKIISRVNAYHGTGVATASLTGLARNHVDFDLPIANILYTDCPNYYRAALPGESEEAFSTRMADNLDALIMREGPETVAAFIAEPIMGVAGVIMPPSGYFEKIQRVLRRHDILLIADEVICGFGRTGEMFGSTTYGMQPDIITIAKQLSAAYLPISATVITDAIYQAIAAQSEKNGFFAHGYTYSGHPVCCAVALEVLNIYEERGILDHVRTVGPRFQEGLRSLRSHPLVGDIRGAGLLAAIELVSDQDSKASFAPSLKVGLGFGEHALRHGIIVRPLGDMIALSPPLIITAAEVDVLIDGLRAALDDTAAALTAPPASLAG
jgi:4-aminobutyrate--pyruvate transaminase